MLNYTIDDGFLCVADSTGRERMRTLIEKRRGALNERVIARSILSRPIEAYFVGKGTDSVLVVAAHHSLEAITANIAYLLIDLLLEGEQKTVVNSIDCKFLLSKYRFIILPCVNPDGVEMRLNGPQSSPLKDRQMRMSGGDFSLWQANARGVDLNHNYDSRFFEYKALAEQAGICAGHSLWCGEYPESEPETRGVANLVRITEPIAVVALHSQGEELYAYPESCRRGGCAARLAAMSGYRLSVASGTAAYGGLCDYTGSLGIPSFTYEVGRGENPLPESCVRDIFYRVAEGLVMLPTML